MDNSFYYQQDTTVENLNDMPTIQKMPGPPGANLFVFHLPNNMSIIFYYFKRIHNFSLFLKNSEIFSLQES
jgi:hypothetical protein